MITRKQAEKFRKMIEHAASFQTDEDALESIELYPIWDIGKLVKAGERYRYSGKLYKVIQGHTTQSDWTPDKAPALWVEVSVEEWQEWRQPTGAQDAYMTGDKVTFEGNHYISLMDYNVYSPTAYPQGWQMQ